MVLCSVDKSCTAWLNQDAQTKRRRTENGSKHVAFITGCEYWSILSHTPLPLTHLPIKRGAEWAEMLSTQPTEIPPTLLWGDLCWPDSSRNTLVSLKQSLVDLCVRIFNQISVWLFSSYTGRVVGNGLRAQRQNQEVKVRIPNPTLAEVKEALERFNQVRFTVARPVDPPRQCEEDLRHCWKCLFRRNNVSFLKLFQGEVKCGIQNVSSRKPPSFNFSLLGFGNPYFESTWISKIKSRGWVMGRQRPISGNRYRKE